MRNSSLANQNISPEGKVRLNFDKLESLPLVNMLDSANKLAEQAILAIDEDER